MFVLILSIATALAGEAISCPASINDTQNITPPPGAESVRYVRGPRVLESMSVFIDHPRLRRALVPDQQDGNRYVWNLDRSKDTWIECSYRNSAAIVIIQVGRTGKCSFTRARGLEKNIGICEAKAP